MAAVWRSACPPARVVATSAHPSPGKSALIGEGGNRRKSLLQKSWIVVQGFGVQEDSHFPRWEGKVLLKLCQTRRWRGGGEIAIVHSCVSRSLRIAPNGRRVWSRENIKKSKGIWPTKGLVVAAAEGESRTVVGGIRLRERGESAALKCCKFCPREWNVSEEGGSEYRARFFLFLVFFLFAEFCRNRDRNGREKMQISQSSSRV